MSPVAPSLETEEVRAHAAEVFEDHRRDIYCRTDRMFAALMALQWAGAVAAACWLSPRTWAGVTSQVHPHVWAALLLGGLISLFPIVLALVLPGRALTRQVIAVSQLLMSSLLIHVTGGRVETHFHVFGSLAFLAFYRDWRVLLTATLVTALDHLGRGLYWPQSIYGTAAASLWRTAEHVGWVTFEDTFLLISCRQSIHEMKEISLRQAQMQIAEGLLIRSHDELERRVAERTEALDRMRRQNEMLLASAGEGIYGIDHRGCTTFINPSAARMLGCDPVALIGQPMHTLHHHTHPNGSPFLREHCPIHSSLQSGEVHHVDDEIFWRQDGTSFAVEYISTPLREDGRIVGAVVTFQDITARKREQASLAESEQRYRSLVEHSPEGIVVYSDSRLVYLNAAALKLFGAETPEQLLGRPILDMVHPDWRDEARLRVRASQDQGQPNHLAEFKYLRADGSAVDVEAVSTPILFEGRPAGQVLIRDITGRKQAEQEIYRLHAELTQAYEGTVAAYDATIEGWSRALDYRDHETEGHCQRVTGLTLRLAQAMGVSDEELVHICRGALLHDIGKMGVPDRVLLKAGPLDDGEWDLMRRHPSLAREMLSPISFLNPALDIPYCHHEKWDGTGYPQGLQGEQIPLAARLFAVVDVWDALRSDRPYRNAWGRERVLDHIRDLSGTHFDPAIVEVFLSVMAESEERQSLAMAA